MHYTSGTTGRPKGVTTGCGTRPPPTAVFEDEAAVWHFDPQGPAHGLLADVPHRVHRFASGTLLAGGSLAILSRFHAATALDTLRRHRPTTPSSSRRTCSAFCRCPDLGTDETFDSLRLLAHAGAPCPDTVKRAIMERVRPGGVWEFYGSTEAQFTVCARGLARAPRHRRPGPPGPPPPHRSRCRRRPDVDGIGDTATGPAVGTIWCDMPPFARFSYWENPEATAAAWNGSACTVGDLGRLDTTASST
jgi:acyl-CoA synthetase (AMP-forming)/AMP-acid ligase II